MFATLLGALPRPIVGPDGAPNDPRAADDLDPEIVDDLVVAAVRAQGAAGLEPVTDGRLRDPNSDRLVDLIAAGSADVAAASIVDAWRFVAATTDRAVKQALPGPYSLGRRLAAGPSGRGAPRRATAEALALGSAEVLAPIVQALANAGCPLVEIEETDGHLIGDDEGERRLFREAHRRLTDVTRSGGAGQGGEIHLSLSIVGGSAAGAGVETILDAPYASLAVDLIAGPDNWNLVTRTPSTVGVIAGVLSAGTDDESREVMLWGAHYAASSRGRGIDRVGLGSAGPYANLAWEVAVRKMRRLGEAARIASMPRGEELARSLDPRAVSSRRAALGHDAPRPPGPRRRPG